MHREVHRAINRWKPRQYALSVPGKISFPIIVEHHNPLVTLREQRHDIWSAIPCHVTDFEMDSAGTTIQHLALIARSIVPIKTQSTTVVAEFADDKFVHAVLVEVKLLDKDGSQ